MKTIPTPKSRFIKVECPRCGNIQIIFNKAATVVKCHKCSEVLAEPTGGKARVRGKVVEVLT